MIEGDTQRCFQATIRPPLVEPGLDPVQAGRAVEAVLHVLLARPDHLHRPRRPPWTRRPPGARSRARTAGRSRRRGTSCEWRPRRAAAGRSAPARRRAAPGPGSAPRSRTRSAVTWAVAFIGSIVACARNGSAYSASTTLAAPASASSTSPRSVPTAASPSILERNSAMIAASSTAGARALGPGDVQGVGRRLRLPEVLGHDRDRVLERHHGEHAAPALDRGSIGDVLELAAEHRRLPRWWRRPCRARARRCRSSRLPRTLAGRSRRGTGCPIRRNWSAVLSGGSAGGLSAAAAVRAGHKSRSGPSGACTTRPPRGVAFRRLARPSASAAASFSISRAAAPAWRSGCMNARTLVLPPVPCMWNAGFWYASSTGAISTRTFRQVALQLLGHDHRQRGIYALTHLRLGQQTG